MVRTLNILLCFTVLGCSKPPASYDWKLPAGFPTPLVPDDNPMSAEKVTLGRHLFYEKRLSGNETYSCSTCHLQKYAFTDGNVTPIGSTGTQLPRNSMSLANAGYGSLLMWSNPLLTNLEQQALVPMFSDAPVEMGMSESVDAAMQTLSLDPNYPALFKAAFPDDQNPINIGNTVKAIASFERTLISGNSPYDRYQNGDSSAMSDSAQRGMAAFFTEKFDCYHCHAGTTFTTAFVSTNAPKAPRDFRNTGLYNIGGTGDYPPNNIGLIEFTQLSNDMGKFKIPTLRNVALTAPYFHDGSAATLDDVMEAYAGGGRDITMGPYAGDGSKSIHRDPLVKGFTMSDQEKQDMIAFLTSLTDDLATNPDVANPDCVDLTPTACSGSPASYMTTVAPLIETYCGSCHAPSKIASARSFADYAHVQPFAQGMADQLGACNMPPPVARPIPDADKKTLLDWLICNAPNN